MAETVLARMAVQIAANTAEFGKALKGAESQFKNFTSGISRIAGAIGVAFGVKEVAQFAFEVSKLAGEAEGVKAAFERLPEASKLMDDLKVATAGTVSELDLMKRSVQAANFGIALESLPELLKFAALRAQQTGQSVDYLVDSIITGIGRKSPLILDNLGISAVRLKEQFGGAALEAQSIGDVAKAVGRIASEELVKMGDFSENASVKVQRLSASWENFKVVIGQAANQSGIMAGAIDVLNDSLKKLAGDTDAIADTLQDKLAFAISDNRTFSTNEAVEQLKNLREEAGRPLKFNITELAQKFKLTADQVTLLESKIHEVNSTLSYQEKLFDHFQKFVEKNGYEDLSKAVDDYVDGLYKALLQKQIEIEQFKKSGAAQSEEIAIREKGIKQINDSIKAIREYQKTIKPTTDLEAKQIDSYDSLVLKLKDLNDQFEGLDRNDKIQLSNIGQQIIATKKLIEELDKLRQAKDAIAKPSASESVLSPGSTPTGGTNQFKTTNISKGIKEVVPLSNDEMTKRIFKNLEKLKLVSGQTTEAIKGHWIDLSSTIGGAISDLAFSFGQAAAGMGSFGDAIIKSLVNFAKQMGEILVASGTAALAAKFLIKNPVTAIAAGVALLAIAGAASAKLSSTQSNFNSGGGGSGIRGSGFDRIDSSKPQDVRVTGQIFGRGQDLWVILSNYEQGNNFTRTQNG